MRISGEGARDFLTYCAKLWPRQQPELEKLMNTPKGIRIQIKRISQRRTYNQNALYWAWLSIIADDLGYFRDDVHYALKGLLLGRTMTSIGSLPNSTTLLSTSEFNDYMGKVEMWAHDQDIYLPHNEEEWERYTA